MKTHAYYDEGYSFDNEHKCRAIARELSIMKQGLDALEALGPTEYERSECRHEDNIYMETELRKIHTNLNAFKLRIEMTHGQTNN